VYELLEDNDEAFPPFAPDYSHMEFPRPLGKGWLALILGRTGKRMHNDENVVIEYAIA
jgi:hypothetical protein